jgi:hypothetical protein
MGSYLANGFPPTEAEWNSYNDYLNGDFHNWFLEYNELVSSSFPFSCIRMIPVGPIISKLLFTAPYDQIPADQLYEDDAPHGRASTYFLASLISYMAMYQEKAPENYIVDDIIHPIIRDNYKDIVSFIWEELNAFNDEEGNSLVFCSLISSTENGTRLEDISLISPNPASESVTISAGIDYRSINIYDQWGRLHNTYSRALGKSEMTIDLGSYTAGIYLLLMMDDQNQVTQQQKLIVLDK